MLNKKLVDILIKSLNDSNINVRKSSADSLMKIGTEKAIFAVESLLKDKDPEIREYAKYLLKSKKHESSNISVPQWNEFFASLNDADRKQREFYDDWLSKLKKGEFIDVEGNLTYIFIYLYSLIYDFFKNKDIKTLFSCFDQIKEGYGNYKSVNKYIIEWKSDAFFYLGDYSTSIEIRKEIGYNVFDIIKYAPVQDSNDLLNGDFLVNLKIKGLTNFGRGYKNQIAALIDKYLDNFQKAHNQNYFEYHIENFENINYDIINEIAVLLNSLIFKKNSETSLMRKISKLNEEQFSKLLKFDQKRSRNRIITVKRGQKDLNNEIINKIKKFLKKEDFKYLKNSYIEYTKSNYPAVHYIDIQINKIEASDLNLVIKFFNTEEFQAIISIDYMLDRNIAYKLVAPGTVFNGVPKIFSLRDDNLHSYVDDILLNNITDLLIDSENSLREQMGIPKIGEGWVSETELYYAIKESFSHENVVHHGKPNWLGKQHLDIYFPNRNFAIEYQGIQHNEPIEYFGGEEGLMQRQKLDERKRRLCEENNCKLIYVYPDYDLKDIIKKIEYNKFEG